MTTTDAPRPSSPRRPYNLGQRRLGLEAYMRSRGADAGARIAPSGLEPGDLGDHESRVRHPLSELLGDLRRLLRRSAIRLEVRRPVRPGKFGVSAMSPWLAHGRRCLRH